ncbi:hypothetical protein, partial [Nostoc sp. UIC 10630]|uniref:hypothetical protein n=1 Tax=Nostoc sp. UIC 10630 TaxID=2100146 RepID=UPI001A9C9BA0
MPWRTIFGLFLTPGFAYVFIFIRSHSPCDNDFYNTIRTDLSTRRTHSSWRTSGLIPVLCLSSQYQADFVC